MRRFQVFFISYLKRECATLAHGNIKSFSFFHVFLISIYLSHIISFSKFYIKAGLIWIKHRRDIWNLTDSNGIRIHNHLVCKQTLNHLAKLAKWLSCVMITYLCGVLMHRTDKYLQDRSSLPKWLSIPIRSKWLCVQISLLSRKCEDLKSKIL